MSQKYTESRRLANDKWDRKNLDRTGIAMPKGMLAVIKKAANKNGQSVNKWINAAIKEQLKKTRF